MESNNSFDWGITNDMSSGQELIDELIGDDAVVTAKSDDVEEISNDDKEEPEGETKPKKQKSQTQPEPRVDNLLSLFEDEDDDNTEEEEDEDDNEEDEEEESKKPAKKKEKSKGKESTEDSEEENDDEGDEDEDDSVEDDETDDNKYSSFAQDLIKIGFFSEDENLPVPENSEQLLERLELEKRKGAEQYLNDYLGSGKFSEDKLRLFDAVFNKNVPIKDYLSTFNQVVKFSELDLSKESNQEKVVRQSLKNQGFEPDDIESELERLKEYGDLENISKKYHKALVKHENAKLQEKEDEALAKQQQEEFNKNQYRQAMHSIIADGLKQRNIDGVTITPAVANKIEDFLVTEKYKLPTGELLTEFDKFILDLQQPQNFSLKAKIALLAEKNFDLDKINLTNKSKKSDELFNSLAKHKSTSRKTSKKKSKNTDEEEDVFANLFG